MKTPILILALFLSINMFAQNGPLGLWAVNEVMVGDRNVTPTAKWFLFQKDGSLTSGNGNIENFSSFYQYDATKKELTQSNGSEPDPYGSFKTELTKSHMTWERLEDGMKVIVQLTKVDKKPKAPWDLLQGGWTEVGFEKTNLETGVGVIADVESTKYFFMWDRAYRRTNEFGKIMETGIWHIGGHSNEIWTITNSDNTKTIWELTFDGETMIWSQQRGNELIKVYFERDND
ncbi:hypothetical protein [Roseivirga spongicola]|nr:hypothetical protein [Roseivirga spongicola]WPZ12181.1 hypothetical protein T7867_08660 [Roseivirga spongicola]